MLTGRREELAEVRRRLTGAGRLVTLAGIVGSGKTAIARAAADELGRGGSVAVCWADVGEVAADDQLPPTVARALGAAPRSGRDAGLLAEAVGNRELVLVLDGCDAVLEECALLVDELLKRCPQVRVLATARRPLLGQDRERVTRDVTEAQVPAHDVPVATEPDPPVGGPRVGALRDEGFLTRDSREVERKKYGQAGARRRFQFSKR